MVANLDLDKQPCSLSNVDDTTHNSLQGRKVTDSEEKRKAKDNEAKDHGFVRDIPIKQVCHLVADISETIRVST